MVDFVLTNTVHANTFQNLAWTFSPLPPKSDSGRFCFGYNNSPYRTSVSNARLQSHRAI